MKGIVKQAMLSKGYRQFKKQFKTQCANCGSKHCMCTYWTPYYNIRIGGFSYYTKIRNYSKTKFGFNCIKCGATWWHYYNLKERIAKEKELEQNAK